MIELSIVVPAGSSTFIDVLDLCAALCVDLPKSLISNSGVCNGTS